MDLNLAAVVFLGGYVLAIMAAGLFIALRPAGETPRPIGPPPPPSGPTGQRDEILLGGEAEAFGIPRGRVQAVLVAPHTLQIQALALTAGFGLLEDRLVPASLILAADGHAVHLAGAGREPESDGPPGDAVALRQDMAVLSVERKHLGKLRVVCFDRASRVVTSMAVAGRRSPSSLRLVPADLVRQAGTRGLLTAVKAAEWPSLKPYASDWTIRETVLDRLMTDPILSPFQRSLSVDVRDQQVRLRGYVANRVQADRALQVAQSIHGVLGVEQGMVNDEDLALAVSQALRKDARTTTADVQVKSRQGRVEISGHASDPAAVAAIDDVALRVPGVLVARNLTTAR